MSFVLTPGERHDTIAFEGLMESGAVKRAGRGRPKRKPRRVVADKSYAVVAFGCTYVVKA